MDSAEVTTEFPTYVDPYPGRKGSERISFKCGCDNGVYTAPSRISWDNGRGDTTWCFDCNGSGTYTVLVSSLRAAARRRVKAEVARITALADADNREAAWTAANPALAEQLALLGTFAEDFAVSLTGTIRDKGELTDKQAAAISRAVERKAAEDAARAAATPVVEGRVTITGTVVGTKVQDGYRPGSIEVKMTVADDRGFRVYGTVPSALLDREELKGRRVTFTATVKRSADDELFGFFSRPRVA